MKKKSGIFSHGILFITFICYILFSTTSAQAYQWIQNTDDPWGSYSTSSSSRPIIADVNNDGAVDLLIGAYDNSLTLYTSDGEGNYTLDTTTLAGLDIYSYSRPSVYDFNGDGYNDLLLVNNSGELTIYFYNEVSATYSSSLSAIIDSAAHGSYSYTDVEDLNADGNTDIILGYIGNPDLYIGDGLGNYSEVSSTGTGISSSLFSLVSPSLTSTGGYVRFDVADLNLDSYPDIIYGDKNGDVELYLGDGYGNYTRDSTGFSIPDESRTIPLIVDTNRDEIPDVVIGTGSSGVLVYSGYDTGSAVLEVSFARSLVGDSTSPAVGDIDGDCDNDIVVGSTNGSVYVFGFDGDDDDNIADQYPEYTWYEDSDADGFGNPSEMLYSCTQPEGYVLDNTDCDDTTTAAHPGETEICDGYDNDCDGTLDGASAIDAQTWYIDSDSDGYGSSSFSVVACEAPAGYVSDHTDCNDGTSAAHPGATEICDSIDNNCDGSVDNVATADLPKWYLDTDHDGYGVDSTEIASCSQPSGYIATNGDCDDTNSAIHPGVTDICGDAIDNDCDGVADVPVTWYQDYDSDSYGNPASSVIACGGTLPGYVTNNSDCDDSISTINPSATEICDSIDNNCDGTVDEATAIDASDWFPDADSDGYGDMSATPAHQCTAPVGYVLDHTDCNDSSALSNPSGTEICDGEDNDCNGSFDDVDPSAMPLWYNDVDHDGYGNPADSQRACTALGGYVTDNTDCDDGEETKHPGATEVCDGEDNDCDGRVDMDAVDAITYYADADSDGFGDLSTVSTACSAPSGYITDNTDCDDGSSAVNPGATEICDAIDNNCDGTTDTDATDMATWYADADADTFGDPSTSQQACTRPSGYVSDNTDCDDSESAANPGATEICDGIDNNCDGTTDTDATDKTTYYADSDSDGYGNPSVTTLACTVSSGYVSDNTDCDDGESSIFPGATEICADSVDNDCDGSVDEACAGGMDFDDDGDGYTENDGDCDDSVATAYPGATEICDGIDNNCDGVTDTDATDMTIWYADDDADSYGDSSTTQTACTAPTGYVSSATDCDDSTAAVNPGATEICDGVDNNCDGVIDTDATDIITYYADADGDGYGDPSLAETTCTARAGYVTDNTDCDDTDSLRSPGLSEVCADTIDNDCDENIDEGCVGEPGYDDDSDGYTEEAGDCDDGDLTVYSGAVERCDSIDNDCDGEIDEACISDTTIDDDGDGQTEEDGDCDDNDDSVYTGATEICDLKDNDCNATVDDVDSSLLTTWYLDNDNDSYGSAGTSQQACFQPTGYVADNSDCNDTNIAVHPGATEFCNGVDDNCNGKIDLDATDMTTFYADADSDGYGDPSTTQQSCTTPSGYVSDNTDCNDSQSTANPGASELCSDSIDNNCDDVVNEGCPSITDDDDDDEEDDVVDDPDRDDDTDTTDTDDADGTDTTTASTDDDSNPSKSDGTDSAADTDNNQATSGGGCSLTTTDATQANSSMLFFALMLILGARLLSVKKEHPHLRRISPKL